MFLRNAVASQSCHWAGLKSWPPVVRPASRRTPGPSAAKMSEPPAADRSASRVFPRPHPQKTREPDRASAPRRPDPDTPVSQIPRHRPPPPAAGLWPGEPHRGSGRSDRETGSRPLRHEEPPRPAAETRPTAETNVLPTATNSRPHQPDTRTILRHQLTPVDGSARADIIRHDPIGRCSLMETTDTIL